MKALVPEDLGNGRPRPGAAAKYIPRAAFARALHALSPHDTRGEANSAERIAKTRWSVDDVTPMVLRGATSAATTTTSGWASQLAVSAVGDFISSLAPISAGAKLLDAATRVSLDGVSSISFPYRSGAIDPAAVPWVSEGAPIPVGQFTLTSATLSATHRLAIITAMTRETAEHGNGEVVLTTLLRENAAMALDASLFSSTAATADRPAGLLAGTAALTGTAGGTDAAMTTDLAMLASAIGDNTTGLAYVMHPAQAAAARLRRLTGFPADIPIWSTIAVADGFVAALDPLALVSGFGSEPEISSSRESVLHMESATPAAIGSVGSPNAVAAPARSLWQTDCVAMRLILRATWAWRAPGAIAWISDVTW